MFGVAQGQIEVARATTIVYANSASGDDATGDGSLGNPFRSFHRAYTAAVAGGTIDLTGTFTWTDAGETGDVLTTGYSLSKNLTIRGQSRNTIVQAASTRNTADRSIFFVAANTTVTFQDLTLRHGRPTTGTNGGALTLYGQYCGNYPCASITGAATLTRVDVVDNNNSASGAGAIVQQEASTLTLNDTNIQNNVCSCTWGAGAIAGTAQSEFLSITNSTISGNSITGGSTSAGAITTQRFAQILIQNTTIFGNSSAGHAGASRHYYPSRAIYTNSTVAGNTATGVGGGIWFNSMWGGYSLWLKNTILANNVGNGVANDFYPDTSSSFSTSEANAVYSIIEHSVSKTFSGTGMITGNQASLDIAGSLALNGSTRGTMTLEIGSSSVAINAGHATAHGPSGRQVTPATTDQRGFARVGTPDIGAYEAGASAATTTTTTTTTTTSPPTTTTTTIPSTTTTAVTSTTAPSTTTSSSTTIAFTSTTVSAAATSVPPQSAGQPEQSPVTTVTIRSSAGDSTTTVVPAGPPVTLGSSTTVASTTSTSKPQDAIAPDAPQASPGNASATVAGRKVSLVMQRVNNKLVITGPGINLTLAAVDASGATLPLREDGSLQIGDDRRLAVALQEGLVDSEAEFWVFSTPTLLGVATFDASGNIEKTLTLPNKVSDGEHRLVMKMKTKEGSDKVVSVGIYLGSSDKGVSVSRIIFAILFAAVFVGLVIPATRRRRKRAVL